MCWEQVLSFNAQNILIPFLYRELLLICQSYHKWLHAAPYFTLRKYEGSQEEINMEKYWPNFEFQ